MTALVGLGLGTQKSQSFFPFPEQPGILEYPLLWEQMRPLLQSLLWSQSPWQRERFLPLTSSPYKTYFLVALMTLWPPPFPPLLLLKMSHSSTSFGSGHLFDPGVLIHVGKVLDASLCSSVPRIGGVHLDILVTRIGLGVVVVYTQHLAIHRHSQRFAHQLQVKSRPLVERQLFLGVTSIVGFAGAAHTNMHASRFS